MEELSSIRDVLRRIKSPVPMCRICLDISMEYVELESTFCIINGREVTYSDALHEMSSLIYELPDKIRLSLCSACGNDIIKAYSFLKRLENTNYILGKIKTLELESNNKAESKDHNTKTYEFVESLKVEILKDSSVSKQLGSKMALNVGCKIESETSCHRNECNEQVSLENESNTGPEVDVFDEKDSYGGVWLESENNFEQYELDLLHATHYKNDSAIVCILCDQECISEEELLEHISLHKNTAQIEENSEDINGARRQNNSKVLQKNVNNKSHQRRNNRDVKGLNSKNALYLAISFNEGRLDEQAKTNDSVCNICGKQCSTAMGLISHSRAHKDRKFACHICSKTCSTESTLKKHIDRIHLFAGKKYQCEDCGLVFKYPSYLRDHQRKHNTKYKYKCSFCGRSYCRKPQFDIHLRYHYNDYRYKCNHCNKGYATKSNLAEHIKSNHIKITYDCDKCDQKFKSVTGLKKHKYSHTGYPYNCPLCLLGQASRSGIKTHIFGVHRDVISVDEFNKMFPLTHPKSGYRRPKDELTQ